MKIWCLFSIENQYDQPNNNLVAWWTKKPNSEQLISAILSVFSEIINKESLILSLYKGDEVRVPVRASVTEWYGLDFRLREIQEGIIDEDI